MNPDEVQQINESLEENGVFEGEVYFSTDGKHTVHAKAVSREGRKAALDWAFKAYNAIVEKLGTKAQMWDKAINKDKEVVDDGTPTCPLHNKKMTQGKWGWYCKTKVGEGWCKYNPAEKESKEAFNGTPKV